MAFNPDIHHRRSIRLRGYDYSQDGLYFVTLCTHKRQHLFGTITKGQMALTPMGEIAHQQWFKTEQIRPNIQLHEFIVMPNHIHGIIEITPAADPVGAHHPHPEPPVRARCTRPEHGQSAHGQSAHGQSAHGQSAHGQSGHGASGHGASGHGRVQRAPTVGDIVRGYKSAVTKHINELRGFSAPVWQRNYHEHIIRTETAYRNIAEYTRTNPQRWQTDVYGQ